jgi:glycosyltransferase involved in cell wall biosynthesis
MRHGHKIIAVTPAGRTHYLDILKEYILKDDTIAEWQLWDNCRSSTDRAYVESLASQHSKIRLVRRHSVDGSNKSVNQFYRTLVDQNAFYIKLDDDIVYLPPKLGHTLYSAALSEYGRYLYWSPLVINNAICSWLIKHHSKMEITADLIASANCVHGWGSALFAERLHRAFIDAYARGALDQFAVPSFDLSSVRFSINCIGFFGNDAVDLDTSFCPDNVDDEEWISAVLPSLIRRPGRVVGSLLVSHFAFVTQEVELLRSGLLEEYCRIANVPNRPFPRDQLRYMRKKCKRILERIFFNGTSFYDEVKPSNSDEGNQSIAIVERAKQQPSSKTRNGLKIKDHPFWSIMIPTYNCAGSLRRAIESVLSATAYNPEVQIEVVDDRSTQDNPEEVAELYRGRGVRFYRQPENVGASANFNSCVARAQGKWVHILHGDDYVHPDFYSELEQGVSSHQNARVAFTSFVAVDENGDVVWRPNDLPATRGIIEHTWRDVIAVHNKIMAPAIVVQKSAYAEAGNFNTALCHTADWDMWKRLIWSYDSWFEPRALAYYVIHASSDSSKMIRSGENLRDSHRAIKIGSQYFPIERRKELTRQAYRSHAMFGFATAKRFFNTSDYHAALAQTQASLLLDAGVIFDLVKSRVFRGSDDIERPFVAGTNKSGSDDDRAALRGRDK